MKILRAIGAFFAKIGRWIANTAWVQPLLIVGGIFGVIFSIPYIKSGIEGLVADNTDYKYQYYKDRSLGLKEDGEADKLLTYLENLDTENNEKALRDKFGSKFVLVLAEKSCSACKEGVEGYKYAKDKFSKVSNFKLYSILIDKEDDDGNKMAEKIINKHNDFFDRLVGYYTDNKDDYPLFINKPDIQDSYVKKFQNLSGMTSQGTDTPTTFVIDLDRYNDGFFGFNGVTQIFYNYVDFVDKSEGDNKAAKGAVVRDFWTYSNIFDPEYQY